ncbi:MAG TPA: hypothetical protein VHG51_20815 [Longimicrobiaceae bacterium]|nr:hypothetical protein [Longimicrobiaceae bacterium]
MPRLAFVGYDPWLYSRLTSGVGARWLAEHLRGGACIVPFTFHYLAELLGDLGARTVRSRNPLREPAS